MIRIGVDVGGTFTDFTLVDVATGAVRFYKTPSTPDDPARAIEKGLRDLLALAGAEAKNVSYIGHGTTVATNIVIERRGASVGLLTTRGFRDILELGRQARPSIYDYRIEKPPPLIPRDRRIEVTERVGPAGEILTPLDENSVRAGAAKLAAMKVESVAICFLHSYREPAHEARAKEIVREILPDAHLTLSSEILPEFREFERLSTTVVNAFVGPRMSNYLEGLRARVASLGAPVEPYTVHSNGGLMSADAVRASPVRTCVSGPAAGVVGAAEIGRVAGYLNLITFDVGGTSTDVSLIADGRPLYTSQRLVAGYPVKTPMLDIQVIGAGGGSIAAIDDAGALKVGPRSAGADPGPVAYGRGGVEVTISDANLCLGRLDPNRLLGGRMVIDIDAARRAMHDRIAKPLGLSIEDAAFGIVQIANAAMSRAIRSVSIERGHDVASFALCAFGGAGPLHAAEVAAECGIPTVIAPREPGAMCARGILLADLSSDYVRSFYGTANAANWRHVLSLFETMEAEGAQWLDREKVAPDLRRFHRVLDARYRGQNFEVRVDCDGLWPDDLEKVAVRFAAAHAKEYGYAIDGRAIEFVTARVQAIGNVEKAPQARLPSGGSLGDAARGETQVYVDRARGFRTARVYDREKLPVDVAFRGPAIVHEMSSTTYVAPEQSARLDVWGNLILESKS